MYFSRIVSFFAVFFTLGLAAFAKPTKRQESAITDPLNSIVAELQDVLGSVQADTVVTAIPKITAIVDQVNTQISVLNGNTLKRDLVSDVAILVDEIINDVVKLLDFTVIPVTDEVIIDLDVALNGLIITVNKLVPGIIVAVDTLLVGVGATLQALGLQLVFATLGL